MPTRWTQSNRLAADTPWYRASTPRKYMLPLPTTPSVRALWSSLAIKFPAPNSRKIYAQLASPRRTVGRRKSISPPRNDGRSFSSSVLLRPLESRAMLQLCGRRVLAVAVAVAVLGAANPRAAVDAYRNYTVGDDKGWYDGLAVDYQAWAEGYNFTLGDFLIFNTDKNHSVVQTRNETLYKSCDYDDSGLDDTVDWSAAAPEFSKDAVTAAVPLLKEGNTYFFSGNYDGEQCENGQRFAIAVAHGQGLPPDLRPPVADAPGPAAGPDSADRAPAFDFSHPKNVSTPSDSSASDDEASTSTSDSTLNLAGLGAGLIMALSVLFAVQV